MALTCNQILELPYANQLRFIAGKQSGSNVIRWVHYLEDPAYVKWLKGGELIIISGSVIQDNTARLIKLIDSLYDYKVAGIIINLSDYIKKIPAKVIKEANELELPLFEMAANIRIVDISQSICYAIFQSQQIEQQNNNAIREIIYGQRITERRIEHLRSIGITNDTRYRIIAIKVKTTPVKILNGSELYDENNPELINRSIENIITSHYKDIFHNICYMPDDDFLLLIIKDNDYPDIRKNISLIYQELLEYDNSLKPSIVIGNTFDNIRDIRNSYEITRNILINAKDGGIIDYSDNIIEKLILNYPDRDELMKNVSYTLGHLLDDNNEELFYTLKMFFKCNHSVKNTAEELYVHTNTIHYRLSKIEDILGISLNDSNALLQLQVCINIYDLLNNTK